MDLNINSPAYYTKEYGVDDDIYWMCRELSNYVREKKYSDAINIIGIVPIVAPAAVLEKGLCNNILSSVKAVSKKGKIDYKLFEEDLRSFCKNNDITI